MDIRKTWKSVNPCATKLGDGFAILKVSVDGEDRLVDGVFKWIHWEGWVRDDDMPYNLLAAQMGYPEDVKWCSVKELLGSEGLRC